MTPRQFEARYEPAWLELERGLNALDAGRRRRKIRPAETGANELPTGARVAQLYRQCCEHLALARERAYPVHLVARLETLTARAHQRIYRRHDVGLAAFRHLVLYKAPAAVRALRWHLLVATLVFVLPTVVVGVATWLDPHFVLTVVDARQVHDFDGMYGQQAGERLGRTSGDDWTMFGFYIMNNVGIAFRCFAAGLALGVGSLFMVGYNGLLAGAVAGFLVTRGDSERFFSFVVTHSAFELTAIVLSGAAGLKLGHAMLAPGRLTRTQALMRAARETSPVVFCFTVMLFVAAGIEAFWSSAAWIAPGVKYAVGGCCWALVLAYLGLQGKGHDAAVLEARAR
ncbi:MAG: stage II sporulation protein M [Burkholderiales bacterium]|nr:stage II sporulation protein M [Burkholderiales bacterium]